MNSEIALGQLTAQDVRRAVGDIADHRIVEIIETGATLEDLEAALAWDAGDTDLGARLERSLSGKALRVFNILFEDRRLEEERRS